MIDDEELSHYVKVVAGYTSYRDIVRVLIEHLDEDGRLIPSVRFKELMTESARIAGEEAANSAVDTTIAKLEQLGYITTPEQRAVVDAAKLVVDEYRHESVWSGGGKQKTEAALRLLMQRIDDLGTISRGDNKE